MKFEKEYQPGPVRGRIWRMERWGIVYRIALSGNKWSGHVEYDGVNVHHFFEDSPISAIVPAINSMIKLHPELSDKLTAVKDVLEKGINFNALEKDFGAGLGLKEER